MPRLPRFFLPGVPLHVIQRGNDRQPMFREPADRRRFLALTAAYATRHAVAIHAYVLMANHVHLLATPADRHGVSRMMQGLGRVYVRWFNHRHERTGTLWEGRYRASVVDCERYLLLCMRYIELNPVRAAIVPDPGEYRWSSYRCNALGTGDGLVTPHPVYEDLGRHVDDRRRVYRDLFRAAISDAELDMIRDAAHHEWALGQDEFLARVGRSGRRGARLPMGRPRQGDEDEKSLL
jgi:putative transposase